MTLARKRKLSPTEFEQRLAKFKETLSASLSGTKNPMYGKRAPNGSGNGWSGWYKGHFFRSLKELSFMIDFPSCVSAESHTFGIKYLLDGNERTYFPDFAIGDVVYEIKPRRLFDSRINNLKFNAAFKWAELHNKTFIVIDYPKKSLTEIENLVMNKAIMFTDRYRLKYEKYLKSKI